MLSCNYDDDNAEWFYYPPNDFSKLETLRGKRCTSCGVLVKPRDLVIKLPRTRSPRSEIEERIYGDGPEAVPMATWYLCEACGEIFLNLYELGYCLDPTELMADYLSEYQEETGFNPETFTRRNKRC